MTDHFLEIKVTLPASFAFKRAGHVFTVTTADLSADIIAQLVMHGATQKIGDAAAGKGGKDGEASPDALKAMQAAYDALASGDWGRTRGGDAEPEINRFIRAVVKSALGEVNKTKLAALDADDRPAFLWELFESLSDDKKAKVIEQAEADKALADKRKASGKAFAKSIAL